MDLENLQKRFTTQLSSILHDTSEDYFHKRLETKIKVYEETVYNDN